MKNTEETSVNAVSAQVKKEGEKKEVKEVKEEDDDEEDDDEEEEEGEEYTECKNEVMFFLKEHPKFNIRAVGVWYENTAGEVVGDVDTYFRHIMTGRRCESVRECLSGWHHSSTKNKNLWETLCQRIEELDGLEEIICTEESFGV